MTLADVPLPPEDNTNWYPHYAAMDSTVRELVEGIREVASTDWYVAALSTAFGAAPADGANITARITQAAAAAEGKPVFIGAGDWLVDPDALTFTGVRVMGAGRDHTILRSSSETKTGVGITLGIGASLEGLYARGFAEGFRNTGHWTRVTECRASYNTVGIRYADGSYICEAYVNDFTFNDLGVLTENESYQLVIRDNIIDNNEGVGVAICGTSAGVILSGNTIEGNRNYVSEFGCGVLVWGTYVALDIASNWFERNGDTADSVDILFQTGAAGDMLAINQAVVANLIPAAHRAGFYSSGTTLKKMGVVQANLTGNRHRFTRYGAVVGGWQGSVINITGASFKGFLGRMNRHIFLNVEAGAFTAPSIRINIDNIGWKNTDNAAIDAEVVTGGINSLPVFSAFALGASIAPNVQYNGLGLVYPLIEGWLSVNGRKIHSFAGSPEGVVTGNPGDIGINWNGGQGSTFWEKTGGTGNTGWRPAGHPAGSTAGRPTNPALGVGYFDSTLGYRIDWNGTAWVDGTGTPVT